MLQGSYTWKQWLGNMDATILTVWTPITLGFGTSLGLCCWEWYRQTAKFDMPFKRAIEQRMSHPGRHLGFEIAAAERVVAREIHRLACEGKIRLAGEAHEATHPSRLSRRTLKKLQICDGATPNGHVWILGPLNPEFREYSEDEDDGSYWNLRVDSRDIYKLWPT